MHTEELRAGMTVLVTPSPLTYNRMHRALRADHPYAVPRMVRYIVQCDRDPRFRWTRYDVSFTDGTAALGQRKGAPWIHVEAASDDPYCAEHGQRYEPSTGCPGCTA